MNQSSLVVNMTNVAVWWAGLGHTITMPPVKSSNIWVQKLGYFAVSGGQLRCGVLLEWLLQSPGQFFDVRILVHLGGNFHCLQMLSDPFNCMSGPVCPTVTLWHRTTAVYTPPFHSSSLGSIRVDR